MNAHETPQLRILICHPEPLLAIGLSAVLRQDSWLDVRTSGVDVSSVAEHAVDVVITDYLGGLKLAADSNKSLRAPKILVVTAYEREHEVRVALEAGVHGYVLLNGPTEEIPVSVKTLARGSRYLSMAVAQRMADSLSRAALTMRETNVLRLLARGYCNKSIASELHIAVGTVKTHVKGIMTKLKASSRTEAASVAIQRGLVDELVGSISASSHLPPAAFSASLQPAMALG